MQNPIVTDWLTQADGLAPRLRDLRTRAGLTGKELSTAAGWDPSKVSRVETGKIKPTSADLEAWARICDATQQETHDLLDLLSEAEAFHTDFKRRMRRGQAAVQAHYTELVRDARLIRHFETAYIPGPLQITEYARRVFSEMIELHGLDVRDVDAAIAERMQRQQYLYDTTKQFEFLITEPVLRWVVCPPGIMRGQLDRLQIVFGMTNVRFGIIPLDVPLSTTPQNKFELYDDVAIVETFVGETTHDAKESEAYARAMDRLWDEAVTGDEARQVILGAAQELPSAD